MRNHSPDANKIFKCQVHQNNTSPVSGALGAHTECVISLLHDPV